MSPLRANIRVIGQCSKLAAVQLDVHPQIAVMVWKRIPIRGEVCGFVYTVQLGLQFCDSKGLLRRDGACQEVLAEHHYGKIPKSFLGNWCGGLPF